MQPTTRSSTPRRNSWLWDPKTDLRRAGRLAALCMLALILQALLVQTGLFQELRARIQPQDRLPAKPPAAHWVALPPSPFVSVGDQDDGSFSVDQLVQAWQAAGMNPRQAEQIVQQMQEYYSPLIMGVDDPATEQEAIRRAGLVADQWRLHWPALHATLLAMQKHGWRAAGPMQMEDMGAWRHPYERLMQSRSQLPHLHVFTFTSTDMARSRQALVEAVAKAGLHSLRLGQADLESPMQAQGAAQALTQAERDMETITGWSPGVLGLYGRIALDTRAPDSPTDGGITHDQEGHYISVQGHWDAISHEWLHALDICLGRVAFVHAGRDTLSFNNGALRQESDHGVVAAWQRAQHAIIDGQVDWKRRRWTYAARHLDVYWLSSSEAMAYAFAEYAERFHPEALDSSWTQDMPGLLPLVPNPNEVSRQASAWRRLLAQVRPHVEPRKGLAR